ncbi:MAG: hypothetical protein HY547_02670 [Elusimicrobia bacterium]|nr:hypothetical protein [Elusimicrobiota bacterium]
MGIFLQGIDLEEHPVTSIASHRGMTPECKLSLISTMAESIRERVNLGWCDERWCDSLEASVGLMEEAAQFFDPQLGFCREDSMADAKSTHCELNEMASEPLELVDANIGEAIKLEMDAVRRKIDEERVPLCLLPEECRENWNDCQKYLNRLWLEQAVSPVGDKEQWIPSGEFLHLELANAFSCDFGLQQGDDCAIFSASSMMSHYCTTPAINPNATENIFGMGIYANGPGFSCPTKDLFLMTAHNMGIWSGRYCKTKPDGTEECGVMLRDVRELAQRVTELEYFQKKLGCAKPNTNKARQYCPLIPGEIERYKKDAAALEKQYGINLRDPTTKIEGDTGASIVALRPVYQRFGFRTVSYPPNEMGWQYLIQAVKDGHPIQISIDPKFWNGYGFSGGHTVVVEGVWKDGSGKRQVLIRDSNHPDSIKNFLESSLEAGYIQRGVGALGLCIGDEQRPGCQ